MYDERQARIMTYAQRLNAYLYKHQNRRTGTVTLDPLKIEQETGIPHEDLDAAIGELERSSYRKWIFSR